MPCSTNSLDSSQEFGAKHKAMKKKPIGLKANSIVIQPPAFPLAGNKLLERAGAAVGASRGYPLRNVELARLMGRSESTTSFWLGVYPHPHLVAYFCLLEQLSPTERHRVVDDACRDLPTLDHPRLRHNPITVTALKTLLSQPSGLTLITGGTAHQRTFLLTAFGHSFRRADRLHRGPVGIDLHQPDWFVPVESLTYISATKHPPAELVHTVGAVWSTLRSSASPLVLLNDVWAAAPRLHNELLTLAVTRHVISADQDVLSGRDLALDRVQPIHVLAVSAARETPSLLAVDVQRW